MEVWNPSIKSQGKRGTESSSTMGNSTFAVCQRVCRVQFLGHTAKNNFAECLQINTRQTRGTRQSHALPCALLWHMAKPCVCCVLFFSTRQSIKIVVCFFCTRQNNKKNSSSHLKTFFTLHIWHMVLYVKI